MTLSAYRIMNKMPNASPTTSTISRSTIPSLIETSGEPDAMPVANGLTVEPSTPIPAPSMITAAPVSESYPAAIITGTISG